MRSEVHPAILAIIDSQLRDKGKKNIYDVLELLGVRDARAKIFDYAWEVPHAAPIFTIWAEDAGVHPEFGHVFFVEDLAERTTLRGGAAMDAGQLQRHANRRRLMNDVRDGRHFIAVLQTNVRSNEDLLRNKISKPADRVKDSPWRVAYWDSARKKAILVRGENGWAPTDLEADQLIERGVIDQPTWLENSMNGEANRTSDVPSLMFPNQAHRDLVEASAMDVMRAIFLEQGLFPEDVSSDNCGYDLDILNASGASVCHVEVKGSSASTPSFFLTRNELKTSEVDPLWELAVVTDVLGSPHVDRYTAKEMQKFFDFEPLAWRCEAKQR
jgi:hypothetical protein